MEKKFTTANFEAEVLKADKPVLVDFYADWCGPCKMMAPTIEQLAEELADVAVIGKLNVDENEAIAAQYGIMSIPTLLVFKGGKLVKKAIGVQAKEDVEQMIREA